MIAQARRAAFSAAANIVEGSARRGPRQFRRFLDISIASLAELRYIIMIAKGLDWMDEPSTAKLEEQRDQATRLTWGLYKTISKAR